MPPSPLIPYMARVFEKLEHKMWNLTLQLT